MPRARTDLAHKLWSRVTVGTVDECWPWIGARNAEGRGLLTWADDTGRHCEASHRVAWRLAYGTSPPVIRQTCKNASCCNPGHLREGFAAIGRIRILTDQAVREIRAHQDQTGRDRYMLADRYGVSENTIDRVIRRQHKGHVA